MYLNLKKLGLYYNDDLVSVMTFGFRKTNSKKEFEIIRYSNKLNMNVIGSASKLFKYFINNYNYDKIVTYSDISMFGGDVYNKLNFEFLHRTKPNYYWVVDGVRHHRYKYNKKKLINEGYSKEKTENEIMWERGYYRIWSCGLDKFVYKNKS